MQTNRLLLVAVFSLFLDLSLLNASESDLDWSLTREYKEMSKSEFSMLTPDELDWLLLEANHETDAKFAFLNEGQTVVSLDRTFTTTTGGVYLKVLSVLEKENNIYLEVEYPRPFSCRIVNKAIGYVSLYLTIKNPQSKSIKLLLRAKDSCKKEEL